MGDETFVPSNLIAVLRDRVAAIDADEIVFPIHLSVDETEDVIRVLWEFVGRIGDDVDSAGYEHRLLDRARSLAEALQTAMLAAMVFSGPRLVLSEPSARDRQERMDSVSFEVRHPHDGAAEVRLAGELDLFTGPDVASRLRRLLETSPVETVVVDLSGLSYCDCTGLNVFANAQRDAEVLGKSIVLVRPSGLLRRVFECVEFGQVVVVADEWAPFDSKEGSGGPDVTDGAR